MQVEGKTDERFNDIVGLMQRLRLSAIPWRTARNVLVTLKFDDTIRVALEKLSNANILAAPVFDRAGTFRGFTDMQQLTRYVARLCGGQPLAVSRFNKHRAMDNTTIRDLIYARAGAGASIYGEYRWPINENASLYQAFERMSRSGQHRLAVQSSTGRIVGVLSQSQIIDFIFSHSRRLGSAGKIPLSQIRPYNVVARINENKMAISAFQVMDSRIRSLNGVAVVDDRGTLTDVISTHDLRGLVPGGLDFNMMWKTVREFKNHVRANFDNVKSLPVSVPRSATFEEIITKMAGNKVHRVFVVDAAGAPVDVISQTNVLRFMLDSVTPSVSW